MTLTRPVLPDLSTIPQKYRVFASPPLRRVYLGDGEDNSRAVIDDLKSEIANVKARNESLLSGTHWLLDLAKEEKRLALDKVNEEARAALDKAKEDKRLALDKVIEEVRTALDKAKEEKCLALDKVIEEARTALEKAKEEKRLALDKATEEARAALDKAKEETRIANQSLEELRAEYDALKFL